MTRRTCPYLDYRPPQDGERTLVAEAPWLSAGLEEKIIRHAISSIVPPNVEEVRARRLPQIGKLESEISAPLRKEINYWDHRAEELKSQERAWQAHPSPACPGCGPGERSRGPLATAPHRAGQGTGHAGTAAASGRRRHDRARRPVDQDPTSGASLRLRGALR